MAMDAAVAYLRKLRILRKITQGALAQAIGVHRRTVERFERNDGTVAADTFLKIIDVLDASIEETYQLVLDSEVTVEIAEERAVHWTYRNQEDGASKQAVIRPELPWQLLPAGVRAYVRTLREAAGYPIRVIEMLTSLTAEQWLAWEAGAIVEIPTKALFIVVADLNGSLDNMLKLIETNATEEQGQALAKHWLQLRFKESSVPISDEWDGLMVRHARHLNFEQKQRILEYIRWIGHEVSALQITLQEIEDNPQSRAHFARILELSQQLEALLAASRWIEGEQWLWHVARIMSLNRARRLIPTPTEPERLQQQLERIVAGDS